MTARRIAILIALIAAPLLAGDPLAFLMSQPSGTAVAPEGHGPVLYSATRGDWSLMAHALVFLTAQTQSGPRGEDDVFSTNWGMFMGSRRVGRGALLFRTMLSLEPATIEDERYPLLFQTGETALGRPIVDGQHPHDFFMEIAAEYALPLGRDLLGFVYLAPVGEPALGPIAFPHRASAAEIPQAALSHHYQDSTHIAFNVATLGVSHRWIQVEGSAFHGAEPDEDRWDIEGGSLDSWSARVTFTPVASLAVQLSTGYLTKPEATHPGDAERSTASITHSRGSWSSAIVYGRHYKEVTDSRLDAVLAETMVRLRDRHAVSFRWEKTEKDELFAHVDPPFIIRPAPRVPVFEIQSWTLGYTFDFLQRGTWALGIGANYTMHQMPSRLEPFYGDSPQASAIFLRFRPRGTTHAH